MYILWKTRVSQVKVTELRQNLPSYLDKVQKGEELQVTLHGKIIARIVPERDAALAAQQRLAALRKKARLGDVISPLGEAWNVELGNS
jgi:prevent-host-death family protein